MIGSSIVKDLIEYADTIVDEGVGTGMAMDRAGVCLELSPNGGLVSFIDIRKPVEGKKGKKKLVQRDMILPTTGSKRTSRIFSDFCWGNSEYVLGWADKGKDDSKTPDRHKDFKDSHERWLADKQDAEAKALRDFLRLTVDNANEIEAVLQKSGLSRNDVTSNNIVFAIAGHDGFIHQTLGKYWQGPLSAQAPKKTNVKKRHVKKVDIGFCPFSGPEQQKAEKFPVIKQLPGAAKPTMSLITYNTETVCSYNQEINIGQEAVSKMSATVNAMLLKKQYFRMGDLTIFAWTDDPLTVEMEDSNPVPFPDFVDDCIDAVKRDDAAGKARLDMLDWIVAGKGMCENAIKGDLSTNTHFWGVTPKSSNICTEFYFTGTAEDFLGKIRLWYNDLAVSRKPEENGTDYPTLYQLATAVLPPKKDDKSINRLKERMFLSILSDGRLPSGLLDRCLQRAPIAEKEDIYIYAGIAKNVLRRNYGREASMALDENSPSVGYQLGRLFEVYESLQFAALGELNCGLRDKYYRMASMRPARVANDLFARAVKYMRKSGKHGYEQVITGILDKIAVVPKTLPKDEQAMFLLGYHHQRASKPPKEK